MAIVKRCAEVQAWLAGKADGPLPAELLDHVANCSLCRGALLLALSVADADLPAIDCDACEQLLPELIELRDGLPPDRPELLRLLVHLVTCEACREIYALSLALVAAEQVGLLAAPPRALQASVGSGTVHLLRLSREILNLLLPGAAETMRGSGETKVVLAEGEAEQGFGVSVLATAASAAAWTLSVRLSPASAGWVRVLLGDAVYRAPLLSDGTAEIDGIPAPLLGAVDGPALEVTAELR